MTFCCFCPGCLVLFPLTSILFSLSPTFPPFFPPFRVLSFPTSLLILSNLSSLPCQPCLTSVCSGSFRWHAFHFVSLMTRGSKPFIGFELLHVELCLWNPKLVLSVILTIWDGSTEGWESHSRWWDPFPARKWKKTWADWTAGLLNEGCLTNPCGLSMSGCLLPGKMNIFPPQSQPERFECVCMCVLAHVHLCMYMLLYVYLKVSEQYGMLLHWSFVLFCFEVESFIGNSPNRWSWLTRSQGSTCLPPSPIVGFGDVYCSTKLLCGFWRSELRSLCWHSKHFSYWIFSSAASLFFLERRSHCVDQTNSEVSLFVSPPLECWYYRSVLQYSVHSLFIFHKNICSWLRLNREPLFQGVFWSTGVCFDLCCTGCCFHKELHQAAFPKWVSWRISPLPCERKLRQSGYGLGKLATFLHAA